VETVVGSSIGTKLEMVFAKGRVTDCTKSEEEEGGMDLEVLIQEAQEYET